MDALAMRMRGVSLQPTRQAVCLFCRTFSSSTPNAATQAAKRKRDPYREAQARARKAANLSRQERIQRERKTALGDPVLGVSTPFIESLDSAITPPPSATQATKVPLTTLAQAEAASDMDSAAGSPQRDLNFFLDAGELDSSLKRSLIYAGQRSEDAVDSYLDGFGNGFLGTQAVKADDPLNPNPDTPRHRTASEALRRIASLSNSSSKDRLHVNMRRCISTFGRHNTDSILPPKPSPSAEFLAQQKARQGGSEPLQKIPRAGPDTGSSEVQIAILTAKIRTLRQGLDTRGRNDKMNKRNLRLMVHKRQKLLKYLERKERGGPRFQNVVKELGLQPAAWKGEISL